MYIRAGAICASLFMSASVQAGTINMSTTQGVDAAGGATYLYEFSVTNDDDTRIDDILIPFLGLETINSIEQIAAPDNWMFSIEQEPLAWAYDPASDGVIGADAALYETPDWVLRFTYDASALSDARQLFDETSAKLDRAKFALRTAEAEYAALVASYDDAVADLAAFQTDPERLARLQAARDAIREAIATANATDAERALVRSSITDLQAFAAQRRAQGFASQEEEDAFEADIALQLEVLNAKNSALGRRARWDFRAIEGARESFKSVSLADIRDEEALSDAISTASRNLGRNNDILDGPQFAVFKATQKRDAAREALFDISAGALFVGKTVGQFGFISAFDGALGPIQIGANTTFTGALIPSDLQSTPSVVPLPAAGWLLLASLFGMGLIGRRNKILG